MTYCGHEFIELDKNGNKYLCSNCGKEVFVFHFDYRKAYDIFMEFWDSLPDEEKPEIDKKLKELGL